MSEYSWLDKSLHKIALAPSLVRKVAFELDDSFAPADGNAVKLGAHVFVTGLARSGTTILLQLINGTGAFAAQTYRDMPFVLAPCMWSRVASSRRISGAARERAHGDGITVDFDSVEAFEEVFWLTFAGKQYLTQDSLRPHDVDDELCESFRQFVAHVIAARGGNLRYLSKNNNNILRLQGLVKAFPNAHIVVPFRRPEQHARSLLNQHRRFCSSQGEDAFERDYMSWLGHHEFGLDHRPFQFGPDEKRSHTDPADENYWLENWTHTYSAVLKSAPANAIFWDYDAFCSDPEKDMQQLASRLAFELDLNSDALAGIRPPRQHCANKRVASSLADQANSVHQALCERARETTNPGN